ncbi:MAG: hypothetical protein AAGH99_08455 [Planctomycetota bacterium]
MTNAPAAIGQDRLDAGTLANENFWTPTEREAIEAYVDNKLSQILNGDEAEVERGRAGLLDPTRAPGVSDRFQSQFTELVCGQLEPLLAVEAIKPRINAMVIADGLAHPRALGAIRKGLGDPSVGVRYPAARASESLLEGGQLNAAQERELIQSLEQLAVGEGEVHVVQALIEAMLADPDNNIDVLNVLNDRLAWHVGQAGASFMAESTAVQTIYSRLITANPTARPNIEVRGLARASSRYFLLSAQQLAEGKVPDERFDSHREIIRRTAVALEFAHEHVQSPQAAPPAPGRALNAGDWDELVRIGESWMAILKAGPFNYTDADLILPQPSAQAGLP